MARWKSVTVRNVRGGYRFDDFELFAATPEHCVMRGMHQIPLTPQEKKVLLLLIERNGDVVKKDDLIRLWSSPIDESSLATYFRRLRKKLLEDIIETSHGSGYTLSCEIERLGSPAELKALALAGVFIDAEDRRQNMTDKAWKEEYGKLLNEVRCALQWAFERRGRRHIAISLIGATARLFDESSDLAEGREYVKRALELVDEYVLPHSVAQLEYCAGLLCRFVDRPRALQHFQRAAAIYRDLDDHGSLGRLLGVIGDAHVFLGQHDQARVVLKQAERILSAGIRSKALWTLWNSLGILASMQGDAVEAMHYYEQARELGRLLDDDVREFQIVLNIGELEFKQGALDRAIQRAREAARGLENAVDAYRLRPPVNLAIYLSLAGHLDQARQAAEEALPLVAGQGGHWLRLCLQAWAFIMASDGCCAEAACLAGFVQTLFARVGEVMEAADEQLHTRLMSLLEHRLTADSVAVWLSEGATWTEAHAVRYVSQYLATLKKPALR